MPTPPPPEHSRWKPGHSGNPGGKTSSQRQAEIRNAELATDIRRQLLEALASVLAEAGGNPATILDRLDANTLRLLKDAEDRGLGAPKGSVELSTDDGRAYMLATQDAVLDALRRIHT